MRDPLLSPPSALVEIFWHACLQRTLQTSPPTPKKSYLKFQNSTTSLFWIYLILANFPVNIISNFGAVGPILKIQKAKLVRISPGLRWRHFCHGGTTFGHGGATLNVGRLLSTQNRFFRGVGGVPEFFFFIGIFQFVLLGSPYKNL